MLILSPPHPTHTHIQVVLNPTTNGPKQAEFHRMVVAKNSQDTDLKIKLAVRMDKPPNMKHSGWVSTDTQTPKPFFYWQKSETCSHGECLVSDVGGEKRPVSCAGLTLLCLCEQEK